MATAQRFTLFPCSIIHGSAQTLDLAQMQNFRVSPNANVTEEFAAGSVDRKAVIEVASDPTISFGTVDLATYWGTVSPTVGLALTGAGATFRLQERSTLDGVFETSTTHETFTVARGIVIPMRLSASQDDSAGCMMESTLYCLYDGTNLPIVHNTGVDFASAPTPTFTSKFFMGPCYINGSEIPGLTQWSVDFGITYSVRRTSGAVYGALGSIVRRAPSITLSSLKMDQFTAVSHFLRAAAGTIALYGWKGTASGNRVAVATTQHFKVTATAGGLGEQELTATEGEDGTYSLRIWPTSTLAVSVASAIP